MARNTPANEHLERDKLRAVLVDLLAGRCEYRAFLALPIPNARQRDLREIYYILFEELEDDLRPLSTIVALSTAQRRRIESCVAFLDAHRSYDWPDYPRRGSYVGLLICTMTVIDTVALWCLVSFKAALLFLPVHAAAAFINGLVSDSIRRLRLANWQSTGDFSVWPFINDRSRAH
jgi:hypothetical protein